MKIFDFVKIISFCNKMSKGQYYKTSDFMRDKEIKSYLPTPNLIAHDLETEFESDVSKSKNAGINLKWTTEKYANPGDPRVWGPALWFSLHNGAAHYPVKASPFFANRMKGFILGLPVMIPCEKCQDHAIAYIEENYHRLNEIVSGKEELFNFFVSFHNYVNKRYGKPEMSFKDAYTLYTGNVNVTKLSY